MIAHDTAQHRGRGSLVHHAHLYRGPEQFKHAMRRFIEDGLDAGEPVLVALPTDNLGHLCSALDGAADQILLRDMSELGRNPGRIMDVIKDWSERHPGRRARFVGQPIWPERTAEEAVEGARHEALINVVCADAELTVLCPYDEAALSRDTLACAERTHPTIWSADGSSQASPCYCDPMDVYMAAEWPLAAPDGAVAELEFGDDFHALRRFVSRADASTALSSRRLADFVFAVNEAAENVLLHGAGSGRLRIWNDGVNVVGEVSGPGVVIDALAGRLRPSADALSGRGLWLVNQVCDLVQLRTGEAGTTVRLQLRAPV
jgi:anti-sigma regulatory factor (Ser/Thr protein kinase)